MGFGFLGISVACDGREMGRVLNEAPQSAELTEKDKLTVTV